MHILRQNYFESECREKADYGGGGGSNSLSNEQKLTNRLKEIRDAYPLEDQFAIWVYAVAKHGKKTVKFNLGYLLDGTSLPKLKKSYEEHVDLLRFVQTKGVGPDLESWIKSWFGEERKEKFRRLKAGKYDVTFTWARNIDRLIIDNRNSLEKEYSLHQNVSVFLPKYKKVNIDEVLSFMELPNSKPKALSVTSNFDMAALDIPVPEYDTETINKTATDMAPNSRDDISAFGNDLAIEASHITSQLARYFTMQAAKPNYTVALVNEIIAEARNNDAVTDLLKEDPNWFARTFTKPQLLPADQMPMANLVNKAMTLPEMAEKDNEAFGHDLKIVDHALNVLSEYYRGIEAHYDALKKQQERLSVVESDRGDIMDAIVSATTPERVEKQLQSLQNNMMFIRTNAQTFADIGDLTSNLRTQLSGMSNIATAVQSPAMNAIHQFNAYQVRRLKQFGRAIDDTVLKEFNINASEMTTIDQSTPQNAQQAIMEQLQKMVGNLETVPSTLLSTVEERKKVAEGIQDDIIEHAVKKPKLKKSRAKTLDHS